jgi:hypothetical protein
VLGQIYGNRIDELLERISLSIFGYPILQDKIVMFSDSHNESMTCLEAIKTIAKDMKNLSVDINILAINSAIEAAHATLVIEQLSENILNNLLATQARLMAELLKDEKFRSSEYLKDLARRTNIPEIHVSDADGVVQYTTYDPLVGWRFPEDPKEQAQVFRELLVKDNHVVCQKMQKRSLDNLIFKYVGVSRIDKKGIVQVGLRGEDIIRYQGETGKVFSIISKEIRQLSDTVAEKSKEISVWIKNSF